MYSEYIHAERLVSLLQATSGEELEWVHVLAVDEARLLAHSQGAGGHEAHPLGGYVGKGRLAAQRVHQEFSVQREACTTIDYG